MAYKKWIDVLKGIGILLVIIGHCHRPEFLLKIIQSFHMPFFFIISGYLFKNKDECFFSFSKHKFKKYIIPYFFIGLINYVIWMLIKFFELNSNEQISQLAIRYIIGLIYSRGTWYWMPNCSPIWFLTALFIACLLFKLILKYSNKIQISLVLLCAFIAYIICNLEIMKAPWNIDSAIWAIPFMYFGYLINQNDVMNKINKNLKNSIIITIIMILGIFAGFLNPIDFMSMDSMICGNPILSYISSIFISFSIFYFVYNYLSENSFLEFFGRNTLVIFGFNYLINYIVYTLWDIVFVNQNGNYWAIQCLLQIILLYLFTLLYNHLKNKNLNTILKI